MADWRWLLSGCLVLMALALAGEPPRVEFIRPPSYLRAGPVVLTVQVRKDAANRLLTVVAIDGDFTVSRSDVALDGSNAPLRHRLVYQLPEGVYAVIAVVSGSGRELGRAVTPLTVLP